MSGGAAQFGLIVAVVTSGILATVTGSGVMARAIYLHSHANAQSTTWFIWGSVLLLPALVFAVVLIWALLHNAIRRVGRKTNAN
jgi:hypothetical protein